jgi:hypothetical protein
LITYKIVLEDGITLKETLQLSETPFSKRLLFEIAMEIGDSLSRGVEPAPKKQGEQRVQAA